MILIAMFAVVWRCQIFYEWFHFIHNSNIRCFDMQHVCNKLEEKSKQQNEQITTRKRRERARRKQKQAMAKRKSLRQMDAMLELWIWFKIAQSFHSNDDRAHWLHYFMVSFSYFSQSNFNAKIYLIERIKTSKLILCQICWNSFRYIVAINI